MRRASVSFVAALMLLLLCSDSAAFSIPRAGRICSRSFQLSSANDEDDLSKPTPEQLGFANPSAREDSRRQDEVNQQNQKVRVDLVEDVDPVNLTAIGFGLIAFNFFVLANSGDGGLAGVVATIINTMNQ
mmetsp:Transcript_10474/g.28967  ORF Transcript_10474/g.28967 Transcript_10474/m.28967 type:complete len:130 (-) Transcript_10474:72-461(-)